ncbi:MULTISPECIES: hypothetical protein [unclassified Acidovorax]|uniref:hypothetical protein n=1 Tax=unclassified Acidovorax TaxID=2684926 RepID=UPI00070F4E8E|nr:MULTISPECIES: hypothetical protein [unclassified Acidovorax]KRC26974.1 hypothetical protein ASE31_16150 [Acidovorax sp. Root217]KRC28937.1 hypothetical protein ASE28_18530 [Acidovorax sp. Root219]
MQRRTTLAAALSVLAVTALTWSAGAQAQNAAPKIAVTDLAYAQQVSEYFVAGAYQRSAQMSAGGSASHGMYGGSGSHSMQASEQASGTYVAGRYSYIEQRELGGYTNDIKGALLQGTYFRLVQGKGFDAGKPQNSKAEQVLNQVQTGKMAAPQAQNQVANVTARIKKGEFAGADYVLFGVVSSINFTDALSPLQGTSSATRQYGLQLLADFSLINTRTYEIKAAFSAQGEGNDTKILSNRGDIAPPNRAKVISETSRSLAQSVYEQLAGQLGYTDAHLARGVRPPPPPVVYQGGGQPMPVPQQPDQVLILK